jgi:hypothetical protein
VLAWPKELINWKIDYTSAVVPASESGAQAQIYRRWEWQACIFFLAYCSSGSVPYYIFFPALKTLNFVDYESVQDTRQLNRQASLQFLIPAFVSFVCAYLAHTNPKLSVPVLFLSIISILGAVISIAARTSRRGD